ncbi:MAG TPA: DUF5722 domain-containing protein, partial [Mycobacteriales bacterium]|nr:DUF5722 domain-containing protein [Mycobacteriales bacterium]
RKFVAVQDSTVLGRPHYATDVQFPAENQYAYPKTASQKGLQVEMTDDAESLGVQHAGVNVALDSLMRNKAGAGGTSITFTSGGIDYYFDKAAVTRLDQQIKPLSDNGALVYLIVILYQSSNPDSAFSQLVHPDAQLGKGTVYAFNTKTAEGVGYYTAAMEFLADRYSRADQKYGRAVNYIIGNEVNAAWVWAQMGDQTLDRFVEYYGRALRLAWLAARKYYAGARVYVSLEHNWNVSPDPNQPLQAYKGRDLLDTLAATERGEGDFPWAVAYHPYPQDLTNPRTWDDTQATESPDSPLITFKNIDVLPQYLRQDSLTFDGGQRHIILSEQGCNTPGSTVDDEKLQAACYAYAYYKIRFAGGIDAFIDHRHVDHQAEGGLRLGLWTWDDGRTEYAMPGRHKYIYDVFKYIDTSRSLQVTDFAKSIIGIKSWTDAIPNFDPKALAERAIPATLPARIVNGRTAVNIADFENGDTDGWRTSDNTNSVAAVQDSSAVSGTGVLRVHFDSNLDPWSTVAKSARGADVLLPKPLDAAGRSMLGLSVRTTAPAGDTVQAQITVYSTNGQRGSGSVTIDPSRGWNQVAVDLGQWKGKRSISRLKVWLCGSTDSDWQGTFDLDAVGLR